MYDDTYQGQISEEQVFFIGMSSLQSLAMKIFSDTSTDWQVNARNFEFGVKQFESTAIRHLDAEYFSKLGILLARGKKLIEDHRVENPQTKLTNIGKEYEVMVALEIARKRYALILKALDRDGVFSETSIQAVQKRKKPGGDDAAVPGEVIAIQQ